jgi:hypothetical protein
VAIEDTTDPIVTAPEDVTAECEAPGGTAVEIGIAVATDVCDSVLDISSDAPALFPLGDTVVTWTATDDAGNSGTDTQTVTVEDTTPPELTVSVSPQTLWPPNHRLVTIEATLVVTDVCDPDPTIRLVSITSDEPDDSTGDGHTSDDVQGAAFGSDDRTFQLRAERKGNGAGRTYTITYEAEDGSGNSTLAHALVTVPKSRGK